MNINKQDIHRIIGEEVESLLLEIATGQDRGFLRNLAQYGLSSDEKRKKLRRARTTGAATSREDRQYVADIHPSHNITPEEAMAQIKSLRATGKFADELAEPSQALAQGLRSQATRGGRFTLPSPSSTEPISDPETSPTSPQPSGAPSNPSPSTNRVVEPIRGATRNYVDKSKLPANLKNKWNYDDLGKMDLDTLINLGKQYLGYGDKTEKKIRELALDPMYVDRRQDKGTVERAERRQILTIVRDLTANPPAKGEDDGSAPSPSGDPPSGPSGGDTSGDRADLKTMSKGEVNKALNQLRNKGLSSQTITKKVDDIIKDIEKMAGPQRRNFIEKDVPTIKKIQGELVKILSGDFSSLKESKEIIYMHPITYKILNSLFEECK